MTPISRRLFLSSALAGLASPALPHAPINPIRPKSRPMGDNVRNETGAEALIEQSKLGGDVGFAVIDLKCGLI